MDFGDAFNLFVVKTSLWSFYCLFFTDEYVTSDKQCFYESIFSMSLN
jgi:hypothetical protein